MAYSIYHLLWFFLVYSILGWCAGVAYAAVRRKTFVNTGFLSLPLCPVYGVAAVLFSIFLPELRESLFFLFAGGAVIAFLLTFITGHLLERIFHRRWWDFSARRFQFDGYVSFPLLAVWGALAVLCMRVGNPLIIRLLGLLPMAAGRIILLALLILLGLDAAFSLGFLLRIRVHTKRLAEFSEEVSEDFREVSAHLGSAITRRVHRRVARAYPSLEAGKLVEAQAEKPEKSGVLAEGCSFPKLVWLFVIAAFLGDIIETIFCRVVGGTWMSRSSLVWGPFSVVWGLGGVMLTVVLYKYKDRSDRYIFLAGTVLGGAYEYACSVFTELVFGTVFWDYSAMRFNLGGRINLLYCFFWGIAAVAWLKGAYPLLSGLIEKIPVKAGKIGTWVLVVFMVSNMAVSTLALGRYSQRQAEPEGAEASAFAAVLDERFPDERIARVYPNLIIVE